jgi:hypothetical protein
VSRPGTLAAVLERCTSGQARGEIAEEFGARRE